MNIGLRKPYLYKSKAYKRNDSATIEVDRIELTRLILEGQNMNYEELPSKVENLQFTVLERKLKEHLKIERIIEHFGTGIRRINELYLGQNRKPQYTISDSSIRIDLPTITSENGLTEEENKVFMLLESRLMSSSEIVSESGFGKSKVLAILKRLEAKGFVRTTGNGRGLKYTV